MECSFRVSRSSSLNRHTADHKCTLVRDLVFGGGLKILYNLPRACTTLITTRATTLLSRCLPRLAPGRSRSLEIIGFVDLDQVDPVYLGGTYYLAPDRAEYRKVYALLREAL
ncbi:Ku protein [Saccharopolyspora shandongensis]|uniref:Ku protein n=1 Tax=Saccharopolyspora shandongensis TaxID=418495 RepID=UPI003431F876